MKLSKIAGAWAFLFVVAVFLSSCASYARFTHDEIKDYPPDVQEKIIKGEIMPGHDTAGSEVFLGISIQVMALKPEGGKTKEEWIYSSVIAGINKTRLTFTGRKA